MNEIERARWHVKRGEQYLEYAKRNEGAEPGRDAQGARLAAAHFAASMAITNVLLADPPEMPEPVES